MSKAQISMWEELIVDSFAGGGGASTGIEMATGRVVDIAINHDPDAILMHKTNHPHTKHYQASVWDVDPVEVCGTNPVGLLWASPDCKHFSKAKGGKPVEKKIRGLAWIVLRWAGTVHPRVIMLENVEEFQTWGPVRKGKPVKKLAGKTFHKWLGQLEALGYTVEWRELVAADYGAPTTRKRFFLIARSDGRPIVWPEPTHAPAGSQEVKDGEKKPWRGAAEVIDWSLPAPSIFASKAEIREKFGLEAVRPLAHNTMRRVARGVDKFVIRSARPFIVPMGYGEAPGQQPRVHDLADPFPTAVGKGHHGVASPVMAPLTMHNNENATGTSITAPVNTITGSGAGGHQMLITPSLVHCKFDNTPEDVLDPLRTVTSVNAHMLITPTLAAIGQTGGGDRAREITEPTHTQVSKAEECVVCPAMIQYHTEQTERVRGQAVTDPIMTIDASNRYGVAAAALTKYYGSDQHGQATQDPLHTITAKDREGVTLASMIKLKGTNLGGPVTEPVQTITAGGGHHGVVITRIEKAQPGADLKNWPKIRAILNEYCGYHMADNEVILFCIGGAWYFMADIGLRMLTPRELYRANGFPDDYKIERDYTGKVYGKTKQVARCGNAVPPPFATALVRANFPEWCNKVSICTMAQLERLVAV